MFKPPKILRVLNLFLSSPGDVGEERKAVKAIVEKINKLVARPNGLFFELREWEHIPLGKAIRTQEIINPYVQDCDVYIGILNKRFGTPTGQAESGTEEEYNLICDRWNRESPKPIHCCPVKS